MSLGLTPLAWHSYEMSWKLVILGKSWKRNATKDLFYHSFFLSFISSHMQPQIAVVFSNIMPSPIQPRQSLICCIKFIIESFSYGETHVPLPFTYVSPPDTYLFGPLNKNVIHNSVPGILQCLQKNVMLELHTLHRDLIWRIFENLHQQLEMCLEYDGCEHEDVI
jgi:hypothetical protein